MRLEHTVYVQFVYINIYIYIGVYVFRHLAIITPASACLFFEPVSSVPLGLSVTSFPRQGYSHISTDSPLSDPEDGSTQVHSSHIWDIAVMDMNTREDSPTETALS